MSVGRPEQTDGHPQRERRSKGRIKIDAYQDWLHTLRERVKSGQITEMEMNYRIARAMAAADLLKDRANKKARTDALTGLYNRGAFNEYYDSYIKSGKPFGLLMIDIDLFKKVNDTYGHPAGDAILIQMGMEIRSNTRQLRLGDGQEDIVARYGGEEIVVLLSNMEDEADLEKTAEKIRMSVGSHPFSVRDKEIDVTISIGGGIFKNRGDKDAFFKSVDGALYEAKDQGRNRTVISNPEMRAA